MAKSVEFFDWKLDFRNPVTAMVVNCGVTRTPRPPDMHSAIHLGIILEGENSGRFGKDELSFSAGTFYITAPWEPHQTIKSTPGKILLITLNCWSLEDFFCTCKENLNILFRTPPAARMAYLSRLKPLDESLNKIIDFALDAPSLRQKLRLWHAVLELFMEIIPEHNGDLPMNEDYRRLLPVLEKLGNRMITLSEAAGFCNLSISRFSILFREFSGLSFGRYERNFRLNCALAAIRRGATLKEAAEEWDFCDKSHLARLLKEF